SVKGQGAWSWLRPKYLLVARLALALAERLLKFLKPPLTNRGVKGQKSLRQIPPEVSRMADMTVF
ncbi:hypothetical protein BMS93_09215, partial [Leuconostoc pseudomesenteroides]